MSSDDASVAQLDSDLLRTFLATVEAGSVTGAAVRVRRTQSAVSLQVRKLEETLGQRLFRRHGRGVSMTAAGEQLLPVARQVVETLDRTVLALRARQGETEIRLGFPEEYADTTLSPILAAFQRQRPDVGLALRCGPSTEFPRLLATGELDLALHSAEAVAADDVVVHREAAVWAGSVLHAAESRRPLPVALFDRACWWRERCVDLLNRSGLDYRIVCTSESVAGVRAAIAAGIGVGVLPRSALTHRLRRLPDGPLPDGSLPNIGETGLVLSRSPGAPRGPAEALAAVVAEAFRAAIAG